MKIYKVMVVGFGGVGQAFTSILLDQNRKNSNKKYQVVAVCDLHQGWAYDEDGLDLEGVLDCDRRKAIIRSFSSDPLQQTLDLIKKANCDVMAEATYTTHDGEPALSYIRAALESGANVITTNKGPVSNAMAGLELLANRNGVAVKAEGTVMSGTPVLSTLDAMSTSSKITKIRGIFNGTCNYILTQIRAGVSYDVALADAQAKGFAEADPSNDVDGWDVALKMLILSNRYMGTSLILDDIRPDGIRLINTDDHEQASVSMKRWRLVGEVAKSDGEVSVTVGPELLGQEDPLYYIDGAINAINIECDYLGSFTVSGPGAGLFETGYGLWVDLNAVWPN